MKKLSRSDKLRFRRSRKLRLSIVILNYNTKELLKACLRSIEGADKDKMLVETFVVDNASKDASPQMVRKEFPWVKLIESKKNLGFAGGNNLALKKATGEYVLFLNSDVEIKSNALAVMSRFTDKNPEVGAASAKVMLFSGGMDPDCHRGFPTPWASITYFLGLESLFPKSRIFGQYHKFYLGLDKAHEIDAGFGTFIFVRRDVIDAVGGWDESYFFYGEDLDLFYRIKEKGWKVMFYPEPLALHHKGASSGLRKESKGVTRASREIRIKTAKASIAAMKIFYSKFYEDKYPWLLTQIVLVGINIKGFFRLLYHYLS